MEALDFNRLASLIALMIVLVIASYSEMTRKIIPNWLTLSGAACGIVLGYLPGGNTLLASLGGLAVGFGFLFLVYVFGGMGGGDVKLMGAAGALLGYPLIVPTFFYTAIVGGVMAIVCLVWKGDPWGRIKRLTTRLKKEDRTRHEQDAPAPPLAIPYGIAIVCGCLMTMFFAL
ncbi:MAG: prepilin peptidase [Verrucomicrobia bacterium]|nr:prepilin peptidase [Verrucomicrobiota bacterium]